MGHGRWYTITGFGLLVVAAVLVWRTGSGISAGQFDPVSAVIALASLAATVVALGQGARAQRQAYVDVAATAKRLAVQVKEAETEARRQLLGEHDRTINVGFDFVPAPAHDAAGARGRGALKEVVGYYRRLRPRRMVITGVGGAGKTVLAVQLILGLLEDRGEDEPVPVRISAALLDTDHPAESAMRHWLVDHLQRTYRVREIAARELVAAGMVLPVLDGLDEMDAEERPGYASRAARAVRACNAYLNGAHKAAMVVTCRIGQYEALEGTDEWVHDAARIRLRPVGLADARQFLTRRVTDKDRWQPVLAAMRQPKHPLAAALSTPWRLTLAATVYDQRDPTTGAYLRDPTELTSPELDTEDKIRDHLLGRLVPAATATHDCRYPAQHVHGWLAVLAGYLEANTPTATRPARVVAGRTLSGTDLVLHELWPLAGPRIPRILTTAVMVAIGLGVLAWIRPPGVLILFTPAQIADNTDPFIETIVLFIFITICTWIAWPSAFAFRIDFRRLKTRTARRDLQKLFSGGLALGFVYGITLVSWSIGFVNVLVNGSVYGLAIGLVAGLAAGLMAGFDVKTAGDSAMTPRKIVRTQIAIGPGFLLGFALLKLLGKLKNELIHSVTGFAGEFVLGLVLGLQFVLPLTLIMGLVIVLAGKLAFGVAGWRYVIFLLCTRRWSPHWLPWRLGDFLHWCYGAGLIRIAGIGYQFRHRELQDYLAHNPAPSIKTTYNNQPPNNRQPPRGEHHRAWGSGGLGPPDKMCGPREAGPTAGE